VADDEMRPHTRIGITLLALAFLIWVGLMAYAMLGH
jgi:hypothetical protein